MRQPYIKAAGYKRRRLSVFSGLDRRPEAGEGSFEDMENLTSDAWPCLAPRVRRGIHATPEAPGGLIEKDNLCWIDGSRFVMGSYPIDLGLTPTEPDRPKQLISMGAYVIILPDKKYVNTADISDFGSLEAEFTTAAPTVFSLCRADGTDCRPDYTQSESPQSPSENQLWMDTGEGVLRQWSAASQTWVAQESTFLRLSSPGIGRAFALYDGITLEGLSGPLTDEAGTPIADTSELAALEGAAVIWGRGEDYVILPGLLTRSRTVSQSITLARRCPELDFAVERDNRLWGCRYGPDGRGGIVNQIYASKLGDFKNWNCYMGLSTDSYTLSLGADGPFTGAAVLGGVPVFFREDCLHKVYGDFPENFSPVTTPCRGIQRGSALSLARVGEQLYYKCREGICRYDGSLPRLISQPLGDTAYSKAVGGGHNGKYYVSMEDETGQRSLFVLDTQRQLWHREDGLRPGCFCSCGDGLYAIDADTKEILCLTGGTPREGQIRWMAQTPALGLTAPGSRKAGPLVLRLGFDRGARLRLLIQYDSQGPWRSLCVLTGPGLRSCRVDPAGRRCDHFRLRLEGQGQIRLYAWDRYEKEGRSV